MSDPVNPYQSPGTEAIPVKPLAAQGLITEPMLVYLKATSPWLRFVGIVGFIGAGFIALMGLAMLALIPLMGGVWNEIEGFEAFSDAFVGALFSGTVTAYFIAIGAVVFVPSLFIYRSGEKIRSYLKTGVDQDLEMALKNNKSLWKFIGICYIISLAFVPLIIIAAIIVALVVALA